MRIDTRAIVSMIALSLIGSPALAQDSSQPPPTNPLQGLFTPQPQYPTPQSHDNPTPTVQGTNPIGGIFNTSTSASTNYNTPQTPNGANPLQGLFTGQPQYVTPQTQMNKDAVPLKEGPYGTESKPPGGDNAQKDASAGDAAKAENKDAAAKEDKTATDKDKDKEKADKEKADKDKEKEAKEDKDKEKKAKEKAEKEKPAPPQVYNPITEAIVMLNSGQPDEALKRITAVIKTSPTNAQAHYVAGVIQVALRNYAAAISEYQAVLKLVPMTPLAARAAEGLRKIGGPPPDTKLPALRTYH